jgi:hypothetical protein
MRYDLNLPRCRRLIDEAIQTLGLDLSGLTVLTEAGTGPFSLTASIAALAGAPRVFIAARDSPYGLAQEAIEETIYAANELLVGQVVSVLPHRSHEYVAQVDIVTNLRGVRPIDRGLIEQLKPTAVVPLMFESWEYRPEDLDLRACRARGILVLGTNESHPHVGVLKYVGMVALRLLFESGIEILRSKVIVLGEGVFSDVAVEALRAIGSQVEVITRDQLESPDGSKWMEQVALADALLVAEHVSRAPLIGPSAGIKPAWLVKKNPGILVVHIAGNVDRGDLSRAGIRAHPEVFAPPGYMSVSTAYVGPAPVIYLHAAGLKVGAIGAHGRRRGLSPGAAEDEALRDSLCQALVEPVSISDCRNFLLTRLSKPIDSYP